eukprot:scaffold1945_cov267-Amphora_coffeaeformis.AAC.1
MTLVDRHFHTTTASSLRQGNNKNIHQIKGTSWTITYHRAALFVTQQKQWASNQWVVLVMESFQQSRWSRK